MAIKVNNVTAIDDSRNVSAAGIATVGSGNSTITINGLTGIMSVGTGITMQGIPGNISIAGTLTAAGFNIPAKIVSISPAIGSTNVSISTSIVITFSQAVGIATTGFLTIRTGSAGGPGIHTLGVNQLTGLISNSNVLTIVTSAAFGFPAVSTIFTVIPSGLIKSTSGGLAGLNTTGADSHSFQTRDVILGDAYQGGYLICKASPIRWVVSPSSAQVSRNWYSRGDASTRAQEISGCTGWFVPSIGQLQNPGSLCRSFWDTIPGGKFYSSQENDEYSAFTVNISNARSYENEKMHACQVRAFRCVTY